MLQEQHKEDYPLSRMKKPKYAIIQMVGEGGCRVGTPPKIMGSGHNRMVKICSTTEEKQVNF
jgi:hypothetical protein